MKPYIATVVILVIVVLLQIQLQQQYYFCSSLTSSLMNPSSTSTTSANRLGRPVKRIAIIGSGISGLAVTHALINNVNHRPHQTTTTTTNDDVHNNLFETIDLFDARSEFDSTAGAGIQLNGGLSILGKINPSVQDAVYQAGLVQTQIQSRTNPWFSPRNHHKNNNNKNTGSNNGSTSSHQLYDVLLQLDLQEVVRSAGGAVADALLQKSYPTPTITTTTTTTTDITSPAPQKGKDKLLWISIMRGALQRALYESLPPPTTDTTNQWRLQFEKKLTHIRSSSSLSNNCDGTELYCQFDDGTESGPYDLIIGCEGINSKVKQYIESNGSSSSKTEELSSTKVDDNFTSLNVRSAIYSGLRIRYAVADGNTTQQQSIPETTAKLTQFFGNGAYALHGTYGAGIHQPNTQCAFIVYLDENYIGPFQRKQKEPLTTTTSSTGSTTPSIGENADWTQDQRRTVNVARENMLQQLLACQIPGDDDDILRQTIRNANRFFELGSYYHNPFGSWSCTVSSSSLSSPSSFSSPAHVVLCGDAAHALPPFLGQGSNQAIQDAYCLVERIYEYNTRIAQGDTNVNLQSLLNEYQRIRWQPCFEIFWKAAFLGYLETGGINGFYSKFRDVFFQTMGIIGVASKVLLNAATPKV